MPISSPTSSTVYLCAPINALVEGIYEEKIAFTEIKEHGDFGLGTFDHLDGEMIMLDGRIYQIKDDGHVEEVDEDALTPFACVTYFNPSKSFALDRQMGYPQFLDSLLAQLPSPNIFYALRLEGQFDYLKARSVPKQECYRPLVEVTADQPIFEFNNINGTLAGFYTPDFMASLSVPGLHLHFLSADSSRGGHLLECRPAKLQVNIQPIYNLELGLPKSWAYLHGDFHRDIAQDLDKAEK